MEGVFKPYAGLSPERQEALYQLVDACVALGGGQRPDESKMDAMARGLGLSCSAELRQIWKDRADGKLKPGEDWFDWRDWSGAG